MKLDSSEVQSLLWKMSSQQTFGFYVEAVLNNQRPKFSFDPKFGSPSGPKEASGKKFLHLELTPSPN